MIKTSLFSDLVCGMKRNKFTATERDQISSVLEWAFVRLEAWFQWFNTTQSGKSGVLFLFLFLSHWVINFLEMLGILTVLPTHMQVYAGPTPSDGRSIKAYELC